MFYSNSFVVDKVENGFTKLQAMVRGSISRELFRKRVRDEAYRDNVAKEILGKYSVETSLTF